MHPGTLFIWLFFSFAPLFALLLLWKIGSRFAREPQRREAIVGWGAAGLALWSAASYVMGLLAFGTAYGLAHAQPFPPGWFPEGGLIYAQLAIYAAFGTLLLLALGKVARQAPAA